MGSPLGPPRRQEESGAIAVMAAVMMFAVLLATSLAVDVGRVAYTSRDQQGVTDRAVLDAVRVLNEHFPADATTLGEVHTAVEAALVASMARNPGSSTGTSENRALGLVELGDVDPATGAFTAVCSADHDPVSEPSCPGSAGAATAVRAVTESFVPFIFALGTDDGGRDVVKQSIAQAQAIASISVGSELATIEDGLANDLFAQMLCPALSPGGPATCSLGVSAGGYGALVDTTLPLGSLISPLGITAGAPDEVLDTEVGVAELLSVGASALDDAGSPAAVALSALALAVPTDLTVNLLDLVDVSTSDVGQALDAGVNLFDLVNATAQVANGENLVSVPDVGVSIPGIADVDATMHVIEAPRTAIGPARQIRTNPGVEPPAYGWMTSARTAQVGLQLDAVLGLDLVDQVVGVLGPLSLGTLEVTADDVRVPIEATVAGARADLKRIQCGDGADPDQLTTLATVGTSTRAGTVRIGDGAGGWADLAGLRVHVRDPLLGITLADLRLTVRARAAAELGGVTGEDNTFGGPFRAGPAATLGSGLGLSGLADTLEVEVVQEPGGLLGLLDGLLGSLVSTLDGLVESALTGVLAPLETTVLDPVLDQLGVHVANADTWVNSVDCTDRSLAPLLP